MNHWIGLGRVGQDPEVKEFTNNKVCKFSLATSESYKKNGEKVTDTTWHNLVFWGKQCDILKEYVTKGDQLLVEGKIVIRNYTDKSGVEHWSTEIVCDKFEFVGSKKEGKPVERKSGKVETGSMSNIDELPEANESAENDPSYFPG
jgi:single-strand DNA-binding protein